MQILINKNTGEVIRNGEVITSPGGANWRFDYGIPPHGLSDKGTIRISRNKNIVGFCFPAMFGLEWKET